MKDTSKRKRKKRFISKHDLVRVLPMKQIEAAKSLDVCLSTLKKNFKLYYPNSRWPSSIEKSRIKDQMQAELRDKLERIICQSEWFNESLEYPHLRHALKCQERENLNLRAFAMEQHRALVMENRNRMENHSNAQMNPNILTRKQNKARMEKCPVMQAFVNQFQFSNGAKKIREADQKDLFPPVDENETV